MSENTVTQTIPDLSHKGVDNILAALTSAGLEVHYNETDGDHYIDIWLTDFDAEPTTILSWRDSQGWWMAQWDKGTDDTDPDRKWTVFGATPADLARDVATILGGGNQDETPEPPAEPENPADKPTTAKSPWLAGTNYSVRGEHGEVVYNTFTRQLALVAPNGGQIDVMGARYAREVEEALAVDDEPEAFALLSAHYRTELAGGAR